MILITYGTRPEFIKIKSLIDHMEDIPHRILFTGQHRDLCSAGTYSINIIDGPNRIDSIIQSLMNIPDNIFKDIRFVMVQGDTTSAMAMAMAAFNRGIPVIHLEAGLRTYNINDPFPEELNRQIISKIAQIHLCPTLDNYHNLLREKIGGDIRVVGNTGLDNIQNPTISYNNDIIVTLHRRENHIYIPQLFYDINHLAMTNTDLNFIIPLHPNPNVQIHKDILTHVKIIPPQTHEDMIKLIANCRFLISDSGGLQEEAAFLNKKVIVCRKTTERPESLLIHSFICTDYSKLKDLFYCIRDDYMVNAPCPYGDGRAYEKIIPLLRYYLSRQPT